MEKVLLNFSALDAVCVAVSGCGGEGQPRCCLRVWPGNYPGRRGPGEGLGLGAGGIHAFGHPQSTWDRGQEGHHVPLPCKPLLESPARGALPLALVVPSRGVPCRAVPCQRGARRVRRGGVWVWQVPAEPGRGIPLGTAASAVPTAQPCRALPSRPLQRNASELGRVLAAPGLRDEEEIAETSQAPGG